MVIASQYVRGRKDPSEPYYLLITGDYIKTKQDKGAWLDVDFHTIKSAAAVLNVDDEHVYLGDKSIKFDTTAANNLQAYLDRLPFTFTPEYPLRHGCWIYIEDDTSLLGVWPVGLRPTPTTGGPHLGWCMACDERMAALTAGGYYLVDKVLSLDAWHHLETIQTAADEYYVEVDGEKFGPFTPPDSGISAYTSLTLDGSTLVGIGQLRAWFDELKVYRKETSYDSAGATAPTRIYYFDQGFERATYIYAISITTGGNGVCARSTAQAHSGSYSLLHDTSGDVADLAYWTFPRSLPDYYPSATDLPVWWEYWLYLIGVTSGGWCEIPGFKVSGVWSGALGLNNDENSLDIYDGAWHHDEKTLSTEVWHKIQIKELSTTEFQVFVDDEQIGTTWTKNATGVWEEIAGFGDHWDAAGQMKFYIDDFKWYKVL